MDINFAPKQFRNKNRRRTGTVAYEIRPYLMLGVAAWAMGFEHFNPMGRAAIFLLIVTSLSIIYMRCKARGLLS